MQSKPGSTARLSGVAHGAGPHHSPISNRSSTSPCRKEVKMGRVLAFCYGLVAYAIFFGTFLYAIGFVDALVVPKAIDDGEVTPVLEPAVINLLLLSIFAVPPSVMAKQAFKRWWT